MLSLDCMTNTEEPRARLGRMMFLRSFMLHARRRRVVFLPNRKASTQAQDMAWEMMVASAAPCTPIPRAKIKMGSRMMLAAAPMSTESMPVWAKPWAVINMFMPSVSCTKMVPTA